ncbi:MAG TPA: hypothetical protein VGE22_11040 [Solimonas sp.]
MTHDLYERAEKAMALAPVVGESPEARLVKRAKLTPWAGDPDVHGEMFGLIRDLTERLRQMEAHSLTPPVELLAKADAWTADTTQGDAYTRQLVNALTAHLRAFAEPGATVKESLTVPLAAEERPVAIVRSVVADTDTGVRVRWLGGPPQIGTRLYHHAVLAARDRRIAELEHSAEYDKRELRDYAEQVATLRKDLGAVRGKALEEVRAAIEIERATWQRGDYRKPVNVALNAVTDATHAIAASPVNVPND